MGFVQSLIDGTANAFGTTLVLAGSKVVSAGNTIFVAAGIQSTTATGYSATDNLGNAYSLVKTTINANGFGSHLFRADVTNPGMLTTITITHPGCTRRAGLAVEFSGVSTLRSVNAGSLQGSTTDISAYPGSANTTLANYVANDLWIGSYAFLGAISGFAAKVGADSVAAVEPTPELQVPTNNVGIGFLYYTSDTALTSRRLLATIGATSRDYAAVGAAYQMVATGPKYNDAPAGTLTLSGTCVDDWKTGAGFSDAPVGALAFGGTSIDARTAGDAPSGSLILSGTATDDYAVGVTRYNDAPVGTLALSGKLIASVAFIKSLFAGSAKNLDTKIILSGNAPVRAGQTIFVAMGTSEVGDATTVTDNLGNQYSLLKGGWSSFVRANLFRADVVSDGVLTSITIDQPPNANVYGAIAVLFAGVGPVRALGNADTGSDTTFNGYPGGSSGITADYLPGDLWIAAFAQQSTGTFGGSGGVSTEPTPEQKTSGGATNTNISVGLLYRISEKPINAAMLGGYSSAFQGASIGAAIAPLLPPGPSNNDVVSGQITLTGSVIESNVHVTVYNDAPAGTLALGGSVARQSTSTDATSGALVLSGTAAGKHEHFDAPGGVLALSGSATDSWLIHTGYDDAPTGAISILGSATELRRGNDRPAGVLAMGGTVAEAITWRNTPSGTIRAHGWAAETLSPDTARPVGIPGAVAQSATSVVNPTILRPDPGTDYAVGDVLLCFATAGFESVLTSFDGTGWVRLADLSHPDSEFYLYGKVAESSEEQRPTLTFNTTAGSGGTPVMARIAAFRGLDSRLATVAEAVGAYGQRDGIVSGGASTSDGGAAFNTITDNDLVVSMTVRHIGVITNMRPPAGFGVVTWDMIASGQRMSAGWAYQAKHPPGAVGAQQFVVNTADPTAYRSYGLMVALKALPASSQDSLPIGTLKLAGSSVDKKVYVDRPEGTLAGLTGSATDRLTHHPTISGRLAFTGSTEESWSHVGEVTGSIPLSGITTDSNRFSDAASGAISISGTVVDRYVAGDDKPVGRIALTGAASLSASFTDENVGLLILDGSVSDAYHSGDATDYNDRMSGRIRLWGRSIRLHEPGYFSVSGRVAVSSTGRPLIPTSSGRALEATTGRIARTT
jgi:hypothetical protein